MKRLGEILLDWGVIAVAELHTGLEACQRVGGRLGTQLLKYGFVDEHSLLEALSEQYGVPSVSLRVVRRSPLEIRKLIPPKIARRLQAVPFGRTSGGLRVAMTSPRDVARVEEIKEILGCKVEPYIATESAILEAVDELDDDFFEVDVRPDAELDEASVTLFPADWEQLWSSPQAHPNQLLRLSRRGAPTTNGSLVATFPGLAPVSAASDGEPEHEINDEVFRRQLVEVRHRDQVGRLLLRFASHYLARLCLFAVHRGQVIGWMGRGHGVVLDDVQSFELGLDQPSLFAELSDGRDRHLGAVPEGGSNDAVLAVLGDPRPSAVVLLPITVKERPVAFLLGDNPGESALAIPVDDLVQATRQAGVAFEILILRRKIMA